MCQLRVFTCLKRKIFMKFGPQLWVCYLFKMRHRMVYWLVSSELATPMKDCQMLSRIEKVFLFLAMFWNSLNMLQARNKMSTEYNAILSLKIGQSFSKPTLPRNTTNFFTLCWTLELTIFSSLSTYKCKEIFDLLSKQSNWF